MKERRTRQKMRVGRRQAGNSEEALRTTRSSPQALCWVTQSTRCKSTRPGGTKKKEEGLKESVVAAYAVNMCVCVKEAL